MGSREIAHKRLDRFGRGEESSRIQTHKSDIPDDIELVERNSLHITTYAKPSIARDFEAPDCRK